MPAVNTGFAAMTIPRVLLAELVQTGCQLYLNLTTIQILHTQRMKLRLVAFES